MKFNMIKLKIVMLFQRIIIAIINLCLLNIVNRSIGNIKLMKLFYLYEFHVWHSVSQMTSA